MSIKNLSETAASNTSIGGVSVAEGAVMSNMNNGIRALAADLRAGLAGSVVNVASASVPDLGAVDSINILLTGNSTVNAFASLSSGVPKRVRFQSILNLINSASLLCPGNATISTLAGDVAGMLPEDGGVWRITDYLRKDGTAVAGSFVGGLVSSVQLTMNTAKMLARSTAGVGNIEEKEFVEGSFTPVVEGSTTPGSHTYTTQVGRYVRMGNLVWFALTVTINVKDAAMAGNFTVTGLPYASSTVSGLQVACATEYGTVNLTAGYTSVTSIIQSNTSFLLIDENGDNVARQALLAAAVANGSTLFISGTYRTG